MAGGLHEVDGVKGLEAVQVVVGGGIELERKAEDEEGLHCYLKDHELGLVSPWGMVCGSCAPGGPVEKRPLHGSSVSDKERQIREKM